MALASAGQELRAGNYAELEAALAAVNAALDGNFSTQPVADYLAIAKALSAAGYEGQHVELSGDVATAQAIRTWPRLETLELARGAKGWQIVPET
jgi:hypothetical protein